MPGHRGPHRRPDGRGEKLPDHREANKQDDSDDVLLSLGAHDRSRDARAELRTEQRPADKPEEAQNADDETLPVTRHREGSDDHNQEEVEHITATAHELT